MDKKREKEKKRKKEKTHRPIYRVAAQLKNCIYRIFNCKQCLHRNSIISKHSFCQQVLEKLPLELETYFSPGLTSAGRISFMLQYTTQHCTLVLRCMIPLHKFVSWALIRVFAPCHNVSLPTKTTAVDYCGIS